MTLSLLKHHAVRATRAWFRLINLRDLVTSVTAALIVLTIAACAGGTGMLMGRGGAGASQTHINTSQRTGSRVFPNSASGHPVLAALFFQSATPTPSQLQQSYDASCTIGSGLISIVPPGSLLPIAMAGATSTCSVFGGALPNSGKRTIFDGTLIALVVTGTTVSGASFQCRDITTTFRVQDNSFTRAYLDPNSNTVVGFNSVNGTPTKVPFTCNGIGSAADQPATIEVQWAKT